VKDMAELQMVTGAGALQRLVEDESVLRQAWERAPFVSRGLDDFGDVFSLSIAERVLHSGIPSSAVRVYRNGEKVPPEGFVVTGPGCNTAPRVCGASLSAQISEGVNVILEFVELFCPEVARFLTALAGDLGFAALNSVAFIAPAGSRGVVHYDTSSVFLRQVRGSKRWRVFAPIERWPVTDWHSSTKADTEQVLEVVLKVGDCLYIPRGFIHVGDATTEGSMHLSVVMRPPTWGDVLRVAVENAAKCEALREAISPLFVHADEGRLFREKVMTLSMPSIESLGVSSPRKEGVALALALRHQGASAAD
jgi:bifunctional lysine-specific demethylase and histidyl-hydroxylase NO66